MGLVIEVQVGDLLVASLHAVNVAAQHCDGAVVDEDRDDDGPADERGERDEKFLQPGSSGSGRSVKVSSSGCDSRALPRRLEGRRGGTRAGEEGLRWSGCREAAPWGERTTTGPTTYMVAPIPGLAPRSARDRRALCCGRVRSAGPADAAGDGDRAAAAGREAPPVGGVAHGRSVPARAEVLELVGQGVVEGHLPGLTAHRTARSRRA